MTPSKSPGTDPPPSEATPPIPAESEALKETPTPVKGEPLLWNIWERGGPAIAIALSIFALVCSYRESTLAFKLSEDAASVVRRKLAIYDVLATKKKNGGQPLSYEELRTEFNRTIPQFGGSKKATGDEFSAALLQLMESKVVIGRGDSTYTLLSEEHFAQPVDPNAKRILGVFGEVIGMVEAQSGGKGLIGSLYDDSEPAYDYESTSFGRQEKIKKEAIREIAQHSTGLSWSELYENLRSKQVVSEDRYGADLHFLEAIRSLLLGEHLVESDDRLFSIDATSPEESGLDEN